MKNYFTLTTVFIVSGLLIASIPSPSKEATRTAKAKRSAPVGTVYIIIDKTDYELNVYDGKGWYATYPVVFGNSSLADKKMEGDKNTPEGEFKINHKRVHDKWHRFMGIDYPTKVSWDKFNQRKQKGEIPSTARIGGAIGIHGTWPNEDFQIDRYRNWTLGCISMKNEDVADLYSYAPSGTKVTIQR
jgi:murein L,D-transpeptidase YafK